MCRRRDAERWERKGERLVPCHVSHAGTESDQGSTPHGSGGRREIYFAVAFFSLKFPCVGSSVVATIIRSQHRFR